MHTAVPTYACVCKAIELTSDKAILTGCYRHDIDGCRSALVIAVRHAFPFFSRRTPVLHCWYYCLIGYVAAIPSISSVYPLRSFCTYFQSIGYCFQTIHFMAKSDNHKVGNISCMQIVSICK